MIAGAHALGLEVLLETHTQAEFRSAVKTDADLIGINNRSLATLKVNLNTTKKILANNPADGKVVVSESGIKTPSDILFLRESGAKAFLVGSAIMAGGQHRRKSQGVGDCKMKLSSYPVDGKYGKYGGQIRARSAHDRGQGAGRGL